MDTVMGKAALIKLAVFDVDGVLTDGRLFLGNNGEELKAFHVHDGLGLVMLKNAGFHVAVISARRSELVSQRMASLGIDHVFQGQDDKRGSLLKLRRELGAETSQTAFVGDDLMDLGAMAEAGFAVAVGNAHPFVREKADWTTEHPGGRGAVREVCDLLLRAQGRLEAIYREYLS